MEFTTLSYDFLSENKLLNKTMIIKKTKLKINIALNLFNKKKISKNIKANKKKDVLSPVKNIV